MELITASETTSESPYDTPGVPRLGLYEELPGIGANEGAYEQLAPLTPAEIAEIEAEEAREGKKQTKQRKRSTAAEGWTPVRRDAMELDEETRKASWFLTGLPREQIRWWVAPTMHARLMPSIRLSSTPLVSL